MSRYPEKRILLTFFLFAGMLISCDSKRVYEANIMMEKETWNVTNKPKFEVLITNIISPYNVYINVRNAPEYGYSNLYLFMNTVFPDGRIARDTLELTLADYDGRWLGSGIGSVKFSRFLVRKGVQFKQSGKYRFELEQAMRVNELKGIRDIGLRIEKQ